MVGIPVGVGCSFFGLPHSKGWMQLFQSWVGFKLSGISFLFLAVLSLLVPGATRLIMPKANAADNPQLVLSLSNQPVQPGSLITISFVSTGIDASKIKTIYVKSKYDTFDLAKSFSGQTSGSFQLTAPRLFTPIDIGAVLVTNSNQVITSNNVTITILPDVGNIKYLAFNQLAKENEPGYFSTLVGSNDQVRVWGIYFDGDYAELTGNSLLRYELFDEFGRKTNDFIIDSKGLLTPLKEVRGKLIVKLGALSAATVIKGLPGPTINGQPIVPPPLAPDETPDPRFAQPR